ncbi:unnamed protein product [Paramecium sonneborni]|uniref:Transmembrane protein n=1 Tax=Paramecium sonneborni TaxID=65129 RepID=A0A8S1RIF2_9CILI|nr:unnamed protein product [Paramecium sonneborni]
MIEYFSYGFHQQIGKGFSSKIQKRQNQMTGETVAIQGIDKALLKFQQVKQNHQAFLIVNKQTVQSNGILQISVFQTQNYNYLITEFCEEIQFLNQIKLESFPNNKLRTLFLDQFKRINFQNRMELYIKKSNHQMCYYRYEEFLYLQILLLLHQIQQVLYLFQLIIKFLNQYVLFIIPKVQSFRFSAFFLLLCIQSSTFFLSFFKKVG